MERTETVKRIAFLFGKTNITIYSWIKKGCPVEVVHVGLKPEYRFNVKEVESWLKNEVG